MKKSLPVVILEPGPIWWQAVTLTNRLTGVIYINICRRLYLYLSILICRRLDLIAFDFCRSRILPLCQLAAVRGWIVRTSVHSRSSRRLRQGRAGYRTVFHCQRGQSRLDRRLFLQQIQHRIRFDSMAERGD